MLSNVFPDIWPLTCATASLFEIAFFSSAICSVISFTFSLDSVLNFPFTSFSVLNLANSPTISSSFVVSWSMYPAAMPCTSLFFCPPWRFCWSANLAFLTAFAVCARISACSSTCLWVGCPKMSNAEITCRPKPAWPVAWDVSSSSS